MILITAATGQVGREAINGLIATGAPVRALVRDPARAGMPAGVEIAQGNFEDDASLVSAFDGVATMLLAGRDSPEAVEQHRRVLAHARRAGVRHIVKLSAIGATATSPVALMREHHAVDENVLQGPAEWTLLKPHLYLQNLLRAADTVRHSGLLSAPRLPPCCAIRWRMPARPTRSPGLPPMAMTMSRRRWPPSPAVR